MNKPIDWQTRNRNGWALFWIVVILTIGGLLNTYMPDILAWLFR